MNRRIKNALIFGLLGGLVGFISVMIVIHHREPEATIGEQPTFVPAMRYFMVSYTYNCPTSKEAGHGFTWFSAMAIPDNLEIRRFICTHKDLYGKVEPDNVQIANIVEFKDDRDYNNFTSSQK